jgi:hypothetical protein
MVLSWLWTPIASEQKRTAALSRLSVRLTTVNEAHSRHACYCRDQTLSCLF